MTTKLPTDRGLRDILARLLAEPHSAQRTRAITKVEKQIDSLKGSRGR